MTRLKPLLFATMSVLVTTAILAGPLSICERKSVCGLMRLIKIVWSAAPESSP